MPQQQFNLQAVLRSLQRPDAKAFGKYLIRQSESSVILGQDGFPMGYRFELDKARVNRTGERLIRALYFVQTGEAVPSGAALRVVCQMSLKPTDANIIAIARVMKTLPDWRDGTVGTAFSYMAAFGNGISAWLMMLYDFFFWVGTIDCRRTTRS
jgi:hypothetical protein